MKTSYNFSILRYVHDGVTQEFVNVGVVVYSADQKFLRAKCSDRYSRITKMFEKIDGIYFRELVRYVELKLNDLGADPVLLSSVGNSATFEGLLSKILPRDDSSIQFSPSGAGITASLEAELDSLFDRYVFQYTPRPDAPRKTNDRVWSTFRAALIKKDVPIRLDSHTIVAQKYEHEFQHAVKNGIWHVCEPVSFDLAEEGAIMERAVFWLGTATALKQSDEKFKLNLLLGKPEGSEFVDSYHKAKQLLEDIPVEKRIFEEDQAELFAEELEKDVLGHS